MRGAPFASAFVGGSIVTLIAVRLARSSLSRPPHARVNYRGRPVAGTLGAVLAFPLAVGTAVAVGGGGQWRIGAAVGASGVVFGALGLLDDLYGDRSAGGLLGHVRALVRGNVTTGAVKAAGGAAGGLGAAYLGGWRGWWLFAAGAVVALGANLANLLDVRPGRALKAWLVAWGALLAATGLGDAQLSTAGLAGGVVAFLPQDLGERGMLGDVGAGIAGASLASAAGASVSRTPLAVCLGLLLVFTLASEVVSFSRVIDAVPPLRWFDRLGRGDGSVTSSA